MEYLFNPPVGVDPYDLAMQSGVLPRTTLQGLGGVGDIAEFDPEPISRSALSIIGTITKFFGFGAGRKEADEITPIQNQVVSSVIGPISAVIQSPGSASLSTQQLQAMLTAVTNTQAAWFNMLHTTSWKDGRAAQQAEATLAPYFRDEIDWLTRALQTSSTSVTQWISGVPGIPGLGPVPGLPSGPLPPAISTAGFSTLIPVALGVIALFLFSKRSK